MPVTNYLWDEVNDTLLAETDDAGNTIAEYTHEPGQFGPLISQRRNGQTYYHHYDGQGSTRALTNESGSVMDTYTYTAFGEAVASSGATTNPFGYKGALGYHINPETFNLYVRARCFSPALSRWLSRDPMQSDENSYRYVACNPITSIDPSGLLTIKPAPGIKLTGNCGQEFKMSWDFKLDTMFGTKNGAPCKGWIVQRVTIVCALGDCWKKPQRTLIVFGPGIEPVKIGLPCCGCVRKEEESFDYWEAWPVAQGKPLSDLKKELKSKYTDSARFTALDNRCGTYRQTGDVRFFCESKTGDLHNEAGWQAHAWFPNQMHPCRTTTSELLATGNTPPFWRGDSEDGPAQRSFQVDWFCCKCQKPQDSAKATAVPAPK